MKRARGAAKEGGSRRANLVGTGGKADRWGEVAKYVVEMGWPMNAVARRLGILLIFFPPHART